MARADPKLKSRPTSSWRGVEAVVSVEETIGVGVDVGPATQAVANKTRNNARPTIHMALWLLFIMYLQIKFPARLCRHMCEQRFAVTALLIIDDEIKAKGSVIDTVDLPRDPYLARK